MPRLPFVLFLILAAFSSGQARIFFVGSNPALSIIAYPQDLLQFEKSSITFQTSYQGLPWWGRYDDAIAKPNDSYTSTEDSVSFLRDAGDPTNSYFKNSGAVHLLKNQIDYIHSFGKSVKGLFSASWQLDDRVNDATGILKAETNGGIFIPFDYRLMHMLQKYSLTGQIAFELGGLPVGLKASIAQQNTLAADHDLTAQVSGTNLSSDRLLWGWSTAPCAHIFGLRGINGDAWLQNDYSSGPVTQFDVQAGFTFSGIRAGNRFRYTTALQDEYIWASTNTNTVLGENFAGTYKKSPWALKTDRVLNRTYANVPWLKNDRFSLNTLFFLGLESGVSQNAYSYNPQVSGNGTENTFNITVEANPNVNLFISKGFTIDAALLLEYSHTALDNRYRRWIGNIGGQADAWWDTAVYPGDEYSWEDFSHAADRFFDFGFDASITVPLYGNKTGFLALTLVLFENTKFTFIDKTFGTNANVSNGFRFDETAHRDNFKREIWFNSDIGFTWKSGPWIWRLSITEPLIYSLFMQTTVRNASGNTVFMSEKNRQWAVQEGIRALASVTYEL